MFVGVVMMFLFFVYLGLLRGGKMGVLKKENCKLELFDKIEEIENKFIVEYKFLDIVVSLFKFFSKLLLVE